MSLPRRWIYTAVRLFFFLLIIGGLFTSGLRHTNAQTTSGYSPDPTPLTNDDHTRAQSLLIDISSAIICQLVGIDPVDPQKGCVVLDPINHKLSYAPQQNGLPQIGGLLGTTSSMIGSLYTKPASTGESVRYLAQNFGIGQHIYAQDNPDNQGFKGLSSLQSTWLIMRNLAYLLLTILFVVIGFAIMLRVHIDPRTVMSIQNQIPKIIIAVIMITFSYGIVGFLIDTMWFFSYVIINTFTTDQPDNSVLKNNFLFIDPDAPNSNPEIIAFKKVHPDITIDDLKQTSKKVITDANDYETRLACTDDANKDSVPCKNLQKIKDQLGPAQNTACDPADSLGCIFVSSSNETIKQLTQPPAIPEEELANRIYSSYTSYNDGTKDIQAVVDNFTDDLSLRQQATIHLNSNPIVYMNGILSWGGGITDGNGLFGLSTSVAGTLGDVISRTVIAALGLSTSDCHAARFWTWGDCAKDILQKTIKYIATFLTILIVLAAMFIALVKVWFNLLRALVYVVIYTVIGPLMIVVGLFPGSPYSFSRWIRALLAHLMVFPATIFVFVLARIMASNTASNNPEGTSFLPPLIVNTNTFDNFGLLVAFGLILITPEVLNWVRAAFNAKPGPVGGVVAAGFVAGKQLASGPTKWGLGKAFRPQSPQAPMGFLRKAVTGGVDPGRGFKKRVIRPLVGAISPNEIKPTGGHG